MVDQTPKTSSRLIAYCFSDKFKLSYKVYSEISFDSFEGRRYLASRNKKGLVTTPMKEGRVVQQET